MLHLVVIVGKEEKHALKLSSCTIGQVRVHNANSHRVQTKTINNFCCENIANNVRNIEQTRIDFRFKTQHVFCKFFVFSVPGSVKPRIAENGNSFKLVSGENVDASKTFFLPFFFVEVILMTLFSPLFIIRSTFSSAGDEGSFMTLTHSADYYLQPRTENYLKFNSRLIKNFFFAD